MPTNIKTKYASIIIRPRITEKATSLTESGAYAFEINPRASKKTVAEAIKAYFDVTPVKIRMVKNPRKKVIIRGKRGVKSGVKKAYVYLKKGDTINLS
jgi:large subunit ribosomal protein L23